ncbi:hypothetical protein [Nonomuraea harbinensis]|uniref:Uncharacterized protein n=1 Tax=Nonomuraea harbinensis TaxID=1286938 RepID=A0ABW1C8H8_9ACTN|nr:hypothetical protein [Nonomuraea harbinensis]
MAVKIAVCGRSTPAAKCHPEVFTSGVGLGRERGQEDHFLYRTQSLPARLILEQGNHRLPAANPQPEWDLVAGHVRMLVAASADRSPYRVQRLLTATTRLAVWCYRSGLPDDPEVWLRHEMIDAFVLTGCTDLAPSSAQTYRSWLRHMRAITTTSIVIQASRYTLPRPCTTKPPSRSAPSGSSR